MKITLGNLVSALNVLVKIGSQPIGIKDAYHIGKLTKLVQSEVSEFDEARQKLIKEYGEERPLTEKEVEDKVQGPIIEVKAENIKEFMEKLGELASVEIEIEKWLLTLDLLKDVKLSSGDMIALDPLIKEGAD